MPAGMVSRAPITDPSNWRSTPASRRLARARAASPRSAGVDTRRITRILRDRGRRTRPWPSSPTAALDLEELKARARAWPGLDGMDLAPEVSAASATTGDETPLAPGAGLRHGRRRRAARRGPRLWREAQHPALALASLGCRVTVVPVDATAEEVLALAPDGVVLANGPGDPAATGAYAVPEIRKLVDSGKPGVRHLPRPSDAGRWRWAAGPRRCRSAITAPTTRSRT